MPARLLSAPAVGDVGDSFQAWLLVVDTDGTAASADAVTFTLALPSGGSGSGTATEQVETGLYLLEYDLTTSGRHSAVVTVTSASFGDEVLTFIVDVRATSGALPGLQDVLNYLGEDVSVSAAEVADALAAETAAQADVCDVPVDYPANLAQALKRRVARNLAARAVPIASFTSFEGGGTSKRVTKLDAEVERFEGRYRKWVVV